MTKKDFGEVTLKTKEGKQVTITGTDISPIPKLRPGTVLVKTSGTNPWSPISEEEYVVI